VGWTSYRIEGYLMRLYVCKSEATSMQHVGANVQTDQQIQAATEGGSRAGPPLEDPDRRAGTGFVAVTYHRFKVRGGEARPRPAAQSSGIPVQKNS